MLSSSLSHSTYDNYNSLNLGAGNCFQPFCSCVHLLMDGVSENIIWFYNTVTEHSLYLYKGKILWGQQGI